MWIQYTTLNGVIDLYEARKNCYRVSIWLAVLTSMTALCCYSMFNTIVGFINSPTMTTITTVPNATMAIPDILLCYKGGCNAKKMNQTMGLSEGLIKEFINNFMDIISGSTNQNNDAEKEFKNYLKDKQIDIKQFYAEISYRCEDIFEYKSKSGEFALRDPCQNVFQTVVEYYTPCNCFVLKGNDVQTWPSIFGGIRMKLREPTGSMHERYPDKITNGYELDFRKKYIAPTLTSLKIPINVVADIALKPTHHKRLMNCYGNNEEQNSNDCYRQCFIKYVRKYCNCNLIADQTLKNETFCTVFEFKKCVRENNNTLIKESSMCSASCQASCDEWEYDFTMSLANLGVTTTNNSLTHINVGYNSLQYVQVQ